MEGFLSSKETSRRQFLARVGAASAVAALPAYGAQDPPRIRIGQIGTRHGHAAGKLATILKYPDLFEFVGIVETDPERRAAVADQPPYRGQRWITEEELLSTPGLRAVAVETAITELVPTAIRCLRAGMHVHVDKPAGESLEACRAMHALAAERRLIVQMGYMLRYNPGFRFARQVVRDGWLGEIMEVSGMMGKMADDASRREFARYPGGGMFELACHLIDQVVDLLGPPVKVSSYSRQSRDDGFADNQMAVLEYTRALVSIRCNHVDPFGGDRRQFSITGTEGTLEIRPLEPPRVRLSLARARGPFSRGIHDVPMDSAAGRYDGEFLDLARCIRGEGGPAWDGTHDVTVHETVLRAAGML